MMSYFSGTVAVKLLCNSIELYCSVLYLCVISISAVSIIIMNQQSTCAQNHLEGNVGTEH